MLKPEVGRYRHKPFPHESRKRRNHWLLSTGTRHADSEHQPKQQICYKAGELRGDNCLSMYEGGYSVRYPAVWEVKAGTLQTIFIRYSESLRLSGRNSQSLPKSVSSSPGKHRLSNGVNRRSHKISPRTLRKVTHVNCISSWSGCSSRHTERIPSSDDFLRKSAEQGCTADSQPVITTLQRSTPHQMHNTSSRMMQLMQRHNLQLSPDMLRGCYRRI